MRGPSKPLARSLIMGLLLVAAWFVSALTPAHAGVAQMQQVAGEWIPVGSLQDGRHDHTATLLLDGRVLIVGGMQERTPGSPALASVEIYDPASGSWSVTGSLNTGRWEHTATLLPDGTVLVTGGRSGYTGPELASAEIYDPASGAWQPAPSLSVPRRIHSATLLADGRVLIAGGRFSTASPDVHASAEIYDPASRSWTPTGDLITPREAHSATLLPDGQVLVIAGYYQGPLATAAIYDPISGVWREAAAPLACHGVSHTATLMPDGSVLVVGGGCNGIHQEAEFYDPAASAWIPTTSLPFVREVHTATLLPDGTVLVAGGDDGEVPRYDSVLIYEPASTTWSATAPLGTGRRNHTATLLRDGTVLIVGGWSDDTTFLQSTEQYYAPPAATPTPTQVPPTMTPTPEPPTSTPTPSPIPPTPTSVPTSTTTPTPEPMLGGNLDTVMLAVLASIMCIGVLIGVAAVIGGIMVYTRGSREG